MTPLAERVLEIARSQIGTREAGVRANDGMPSTRYMGGREEPWCAHFVAYCFRVAGRPLPRDVKPSPRTANPLAGVAYMEQVFEEQDWLVVKPMPGDVVFLAGRGKSDAGPGRHVGIVEAVELHLIRTVEGNVGNAVKRVTYRTTTLAQVVTSYGRVPDIGT